MILLKLIRLYKKATYTIGNLLVDGAFFCDTLEDKDRGLTQDMPLPIIEAAKVYGETAIPAGVYDIDMETRSPKYSEVEWYRKLNGGYMPTVCEVPGFTRVLIHPGNKPLDTMGCILVGENKVKGQLVNSRATFAKLYKLMKAAHDRGEDIILQIGYE